VCEGGGTRPGGLSWFSWPGRCLQRQHTSCPNQQPQRNRTGPEGVVPDSGALRNAMVVNLGTCLGALSFLVGAYLLLPRSPAKRTLTVGGTPA